MLVVVVACLALKDSFWAEKRPFHKVILCHFSQGYFESLLSVCHARIFGMQILESEFQYTRRDIQYVNTLRSLWSLNMSFGTNNESGIVV